MMEEKTPLQRGQDLVRLIYKTSGTKQRHDDLILAAKTLKRNSLHFNITTLVEMLNRKMKPNEGIVISYHVFSQLFGNKPTQFDMEVMLTITSKNDLSIVPIYRKVDDEMVAAFIVIHRKLYMATEISEEMRKIITGKPESKNPKSWIVGTAIKISEELGQLLSKAQTIYKADLLDALNILRGDEVYFMSYNFFLLNKLNPLEVIPFLAEKSFYVDKIKSDVMRDAENNEFYKDIAEIAGITISRTETGMLIGRDNIEILFRCSEQIDSSLQKAQFVAKGLDDGHALTMH